ncbi:MAG TPA: ArsR family transcriptional regulator [Nitrososphaerales archaeon]|nr:ArsR family transcriptional regulator [Nitrososphaerales archaeon]
MVDFDELLGIIGSGTRLRLLELLCVRARSLNELASNLGVTQQAILKHLHMLEQLDLVQEINVGRKSRVRKIYALSRPLSMGYVFRDNILCLFVGSNGKSIKSAGNVMELLKQTEYERSLLHMRAKLLANRLRSLVEEDLEKQAEIRNSIKNLKLSPIQEIALQCSNMINSERQLEQASKVLGMNLKDTAKQMLESQA